MTSYKTKRNLEFTGELTIKYLNDRARVADITVCSSGAGKNRIKHSLGEH